MNLKQCSDCHKEYSVRAQTCIHCGAPNEDFVSTTNQAEEKKKEGTSAWVWVAVVIAFFVSLFATSPSTLSSFIHFFKPDQGLVADSDMKSCNSTGVKNEMKRTFDQSQYAITYNLKAIDIKTTDLGSENGEALRCQSEILLNNSESIHYVFSFKKQDDQYLITGQPL